MNMRQDSGSISARVGINGFGRMGRLAMRAAWDRPELAFAHVNELNGDASTAAHLLTFDSIHGRWSEDVQGDGDVLKVNGTELGYSSAAEPGDVPWGELGVEIVLECSGRFRTPEALEAYFRQGVRKVIVAAPVKEKALNIVVGVNDHLYDPQRDHLLTAASCTTNCLAPVVKVIHEGIGIRHGLITTLHDEHPDADRRPPQGPAQGARRERLTDPHDHRVCDRDRAHLPRARRKAQRPGRARATAKRVADRLRL
jgi:glyceraldehyde 3-phosphate dehydrogenase